MVGEEISGSDETVIEEPFPMRQYCDVCHDSFKLYYEHINGF